MNSGCRHAWGLLLKSLNRKSYPAYCQNQRLHQDEFIPMTEIFEEFIFSQNPSENRRGFRI